MTELNDRFEFRVRWEPFLLRPQTPPEGAPSPKFDENNPRVVMLRETGAKIGLNFKKRPDRTPNTLKSHVLLEYAKEKDGEKRQNVVVERLFEAFFTDGLFLDDGTLVTVAEKSGLDKKEVKEILRDESRIARAHEKAKDWSRQGVTGVPCFYMNGQRVFSGAQDSDTIVKVIQQIAQKFPLKKSTL